MAQSMKKKNHIDKHQVSTSWRAGGRILEEAWSVGVSVERECTSVDIDTAREGFKQWRNIFHFYIISIIIVINFIIFFVKIFLNFFYLF